MKFYFLDVKLDRYASSPFKGGLPFVVSKEESSDTTIFCPRYVVS